MRREVGLWIDHRKTVMVTVIEQKAETRLIRSHMEKHIRWSGGAEQVSAEDQRDRRFEEHLHKYYQRVVSYLRDADSILILGPGEAKVELGKCLGSAGLSARIVGIEPADKMTDRQIAAEVRQRLEPPQAQRPKADAAD